MGVYGGIRRPDLSRVPQPDGPYPIYPESSPYRVRLPETIAHALGWPRDPDSFSCYGVFRTDGELLCAPDSIVTATGDHPFRSAIEFRDANCVRDADATVSLEDLPPIRYLVLELQVFEFEAKWTNAKRSQLDLQLGTPRTSLLGWQRHGDEPVYAVVLGAVLALIAARKVRAIQQTGVTGGA